MKMKRTSVGTEYQPVTMRDMLAALLSERRYAYDLGQQLWPHLHGRGSSNGGPTSCAVAATYLLARMRVKGWVEKEFNRDGSMGKWYLTTEGRGTLRKMLERDSKTEVCTEVCTGNPESERL